MVNNNSVKKAESISIICLLITEINCTYSLWFYTSTIEIATAPMV